MRHKPQRERTSPTNVVIVSDNSETLDGLQAYFRNAGVAARAIRRLDGPLVDRDGVAAVVFFPDDFAVADVMEAVKRLVRAHPAILPVLVTCNLRRFQPLVAACGAEIPPIVLPKPAWGWTILDAIHGRSEAS